MVQETVLTRTQRMAVSFQALNGRVVREIGFFRQMSIKLYGVEDTMQRLQITESVQLWSDGIFEIQVIHLSCWQPCIMPYIIHFSRIRPWLDLILND